MTWGPLFGPMCPAFAADVASFCDLALGTFPWVAPGVIYIVFWMTFGSYGHQFVTKCQSIQDQTHPD